MSWCEQLARKKEVDKVFRIRGVNRQDRQYHVDLIRKVSNNDLGAAIILAAVYFEWCVRRCIIALGTSPVTYLREKLNDHRMNAERLQKLWTAEVGKHYPELQTLSYIFDSQKNKPKFGNLQLDWKSIDYARQMRNRLVHGERCTPLEKNGQKFVEILLAASDILVNLAESKGHSIFMIIRRNTNKTVDIQSK